MGKKKFYINEEKPYSGTFFLQEKPLRIYFLFVVL